MCRCVLGPLIVASACIVAGTTWPDCSNGSTPQVLANQPAKQEGALQTIDLDKNLELQMVKIKAGNFIMGSSDSDQDAWAEEKPQHEVKLTRDFLIGKYPVTFDEFAFFVKEEGFRTECERNGKGSWGYDSATNRRIGKAQPVYNWRNPGFPQTGKDPVVNVTWNDAQAFCRWLSKKKGLTCELPTEAQWEFACRAGGTSRYLTGNEPQTLSGFANVADVTLKQKQIKGYDNAQYFPFADGFVFTSPVDSMRPNNWGLHDMSGNVAQWCSDSYDEHFYTEKSKDDPYCSQQNNDTHVLRGSSWFQSPKSCRVAYRFGIESSFSNDLIGFRVMIRID